MAKKLENNGKGCTMKHTFLIAVLSIVFACNSKSAVNAEEIKATVTKNLEVKADTSLKGTWQLQTRSEVKLPVAAPTLTINTSDNTFRGNTGCNNMSGTFTRERDNEIVFGPDIIVTKKACPNYNEKAFLTNFTQTNHYRIENGVLQLLNNDEVLTTWIRQSSIKDSANKI